MSFEQKSILDLCGYFSKPEKSLTIEEIKDIIESKEMTDLDINTKK